jgi:Carboxypeptidase regulatory-like domain
MCSLRISGPFILTAMLTATLSLQSHAQSPQTQTNAVSPSTQTTASEPASAPADLRNVLSDKLPDEPGSHITNPPDADQRSGSIIGTVLDTAGAEITDALVTLENTDSKTQRMLTTDSAGSFKFESIEPGRFNLTITSTGFAPWVSPDLALNTGQSYAVPPIALQIASTMTDVEVTVTRHDIAEDQMHFEEDQRVLGVFPNFYVSYVRNPAPFSAGQKFRLALRTSADPVSIAIPGIIAGVEQWHNGFSGYGQGAAGYAKRFGASSADSVISTMIGDAILPSVLHQDPRYFYKGAGSIHSRALYAISAVFICKGDNGHWQPNYSNLLGNLASAGISNLYYPSTDRHGAGLTIDNWLAGNAADAVATLFQEFLVKKISLGIHRQPEL